MKKLFLIVTFLAFALSSCSINNDQENVTYEILPVAEVELPEVFKVNVDNEIKVYYTRPSDCHMFKSFYYEKKGNIRTVAVETAVFNDNDCVPLTENNLVSQILKFNPKEPGTYVFKFWQGKNESNEDLFLTYDIVVEM